MDTITYEFPPKWNEDYISNNIHIAINNCATSFHKQSGIINQLNEVLNHFEKVTSYTIDQSEIINMLLLIRARNMLFTASMLSMAGINPEIYPLLRVCLECSLYSLHMNKNPELEEVWLNRGVNEDSKVAVRNNFKTSIIMKTLESENINLHASVRELYERCIDLGAHPNEMFVSGNCIALSNDKINVSIFRPDRLQQKAAYSTTIRIGVLTLKVYRYLFKHRFDLLGITEFLDKYKPR